MFKRILYALAGLLLVVGILAGIKTLQIRSMIAAGKQFSMPPEPVTTVAVRQEKWEQQLFAVGSLEAVQGITVTAELSGAARKIHFTPGAQVEAGALLVQQDISAETAQLHAAEAALTLARLELERKRTLLQQKTSSKAEYDMAEVQVQEALAQVDTIRSTLDKKTIRAPFAGKLGIRLINEGQILKEGTAIVSLQSLGHLFVNFSLPQKDIGRIAEGLAIQVSSDSPPEHPLHGTITSINPQVDAATRTIQVQAAMKNPEAVLRPGMFVRVAVVLPSPLDVLAIPATAVLHAPYSDSVFIVTESKQDKSSDQATGGKIVQQQFVRLGEKKGDFVAVLSGLQGNETIVTTGVFKLRNGQPVIEDNSKSPPFQHDPKPAEG